MTDHASDIVLRDARHEDIPAIVALVESAYRGDVSRQGWTTEADLLDGQRIAPEVLQADIEREFSRVLLGLRAGQIVACAHVAIQDGQGYFGMFAVRPDGQGGGVGKVVLSEAERIVREEWHVSRMRMAVIDLREELIAFYERRGYRRTGEKKPFPYGDARFGKPLRDDLRFDVLEKAL
ncbi:GNAT family N-acetyltransferase [Xanthomonadaceae bacterium JHOS43]|nr:GNAT family N-acetyltransferase [Xanthomonadaceae bacterium JHOS43]MCX7562671.1 GNAT family N-acetyltransferase [Xanthomonadaceae bacterium XH05]